MTSALPWRRSTTCSRASGTIEAMVPDARERATLPLVDGRLASLRIGPDGPVLAHPTRDALREALAAG